MMDADTLARVERLTVKGKHAQIQTADDFDWSQKHGVPFWLPNRLAAWAVSQFMHGERATAEMCHMIAPRLNCPMASAFLETQRADELRHAEIYNRYLKKIGGPRPISKHLQGAYQAGRDWDGPVEGVLLAYHVMLEGESLFLQQDVARWLPSPLFNQMSAVIARDEARHVAFGKIWLRQAMPKLSPEEHTQIHSWLRELWFETMESVISRLKPFDFVNGPKPWREWLDENWAMRECEMINAGLVIEGCQKRRVAA